ncbi:hypothetical protein [Asanoa iriomotensis]|uniref:Uncharacterized protein n=1 Tax=Asanoa iriomotensis TaxID=234613 RepID=A0ABQ4C3F5_9ACTN|nr:hypothetical protein [Asanoa iriomotensis]GIF57320.1 hypothetical protein Air01nite_34150 [Asanoa iriomotensis]
MRRTGPVVAAALLALGTLVASSAHAHRPAPAPAPVIEVTPGSGAAGLTLTIGPLETDPCDPRM